MDLDARQQAEFVGEITRHQGALRGYIVSLMPGISGVGDVLQETNLVLWEKRHKYEPGSNFRAWAFAIARLRVKMHRRQLMRLGSPLLDEDLAEELAEEAEETPEEVEERLSALSKCLRRLDEKNRRLIEHHYFSADSLESLSVSCGRPVNSLRVTLCRIRAALRKCINHEVNVSRLRP